MPVGRGTVGACDVCMCGTLRASKGATVEWLRAEVEDFYEVQASLVAFCEALEEAEAGLSTPAMFASREAFEAWNH